MSDVSTIELKKAVESQHGGTATLAQTVPVREIHDHQTIWDGVISVFDLAGHPDAKQAYAWSYELPGGRRQFFAMLHAGPITSPRDAVRASIVAEHGAK
jgi:hypothetical protein